MKQLHITVSTGITVIIDLPCGNITDMRSMTEAFVKTDCTIRIGDSMVFNKNHIVYYEVKEPKVHTTQLRGANGKEI